MPYNVLKVLSHLRYLEYVRMEVGMLKQYAAEPRKYEIHNRELFDSWKSNAEEIKERYDNNPHKGKQKLEIGLSPADMQQQELTECFFQYYREQVLEKELSVIYWEMCTGKPMGYSQKRRRKFDANGVPCGTHDKTEFQLALAGLNHLIDWVEQIVCKEKLIV